MMVARNLFGFLIVSARQPEQFARYLEGRCTTSGVCADEPAAVRACLVSFQSAAMQEGPLESKLVHL